MLVTVKYAGEQVEFDLPDGQVVGVWRGPEGLASIALEAAARQALLEPEGYPAAGRLVVPGDRVTLAVDPAAPGLETVLRALTDVLFGAGVEAGDLTLVAPAGAYWRPEGSTAVVHDPCDASQIAYLATTSAGRRVYLSRLATDADVVIAIGGVRPTLTGDPRGPWRLIFPELSNDATRREPPRTARPAKPARKGEGTIDESVEASMLLGSRFHVAIVPAASGALEVIAGRDDAVHARALESLEASWRFETQGRAEVVVAGVGGPGSAATLDDLALALGTAAELVDRGGRIVVLSKAGGPIGPALGRLMRGDQPRGAPEILRGLEHEADYPAADAIARAAAWADVFLASALDPQTVEDLGMTPLERPDQARRLVAQAYSCTFVDRAEIARARAIA